MTAATADTAEAMELIAVQMLSIGFLLSVDNYYNNKVCKESKGDTPWEAGVGGQAAPNRPTAQPATHGPQHPTP